MGLCGPPAPSHPRVRRRRRARCGSARAAAGGPAPRPERGSTPARAPESPPSWGSVCGGGRGVLRRNKQSTSSDNSTRRRKDASPPTTPVLKLPLLLPRAHLKPVRTTPLRGFSHHFSKSRRLMPDCRGFDDG